MTKLKKIYYPILAVLFVIALVLGVVFSQISTGKKSDETFVGNVRAIMSSMNFVHNSYEKENQDNVRNFIVSNNLANEGFENARGTMEQDYADCASLDRPSYVVQNVILSEESFEDMVESDDELFYSARELQNIIVAFPGENSENVVLFVANYDSAAGSQSGIEGMQAATMLQTIIELNKNFESKKPENTLVFLFSDAEHEGAYGTYAFKNQFKGFDDIAQKVKLVINFDVKGTGALAVSSKGISVSEVNGLASVINDEMYPSGTHTDYDVYDTAKLNVFFSGSRDYLNTIRDTVSNVDDSKIATMGGVMNSLIETYGYGKIEETEATGSFSYLGATFSYSSAISYIFGAIAILLLIASVFELIRHGKKASGIIRGTVAQIAALIIAAIVLYACYFILAYLLVGFGVLPVQAVISVKYMNVGLFISSLLLAFAAYTGVFLVLRRIYKIKATEAARGGALLIMLVGIILSFAMPDASLIFALTALLEGLALLITTELSNKFKEKHGADIERLFIYTLPLILLTPAMIPVLITVSYSISAVYLPLIMLAAVLGMTVIAPYFAMLKPALSAAVAKLPKHTIRVERTVTEQVEGAKKGRFEEKTYKKVVNEKVEWRYHNRYGIAFIAILAAVMVLLFAGCPTKHFSTNNADEFGYRDALKNDSIVYAWDKNGSIESEKVRVYDKYAYSFIEKVTSDFTWNKNIGAYETDTFDSDSLLGTATLPSIKVSSDSNSTLQFSAFDKNYESMIDVVFTNVANVTKFTVISVGEYYEIENDGKDTFCLEIPYDDDNFADFSVEFEFEGELAVGVKFTQRTFGNTTVNRFQHAEGIYKEIDNSDIKSSIEDELFEYNDSNKHIACGMIFTINSNFTLQNDIG